MRILGVTLLELLLVVAIIAILAASATPFVSGTLQRYQATTAQDRLLGALRKAQSFSMDHRLGEQWGVCLTAGKLRLFAGSCTSPVRNEDWTLPATVSITGFSEVVFGIYRGQPSSTPTITVATQVKTSTVTVNRIGGLDVD